MPVEPTERQVVAAVKAVLQCTLSEAECSHDFDMVCRESKEVYRAMISAAPAVQGEPVAWSGWGCQYPGKMPRLYGDRRIAELNCDWENGDQVLYFTAAPQPAEQQSCPVCKGCGLNPLTDAPVACANCHGITPAEQQPAPDVAALVEALKGALENLEKYAVIVDGEWGSCRDLEGLEADGELPECIKDVRAALSVYRKGGK